MDKDYYFTISVTLEVQITDGTLVRQKYVTLIRERLFCTVDQASKIGRRMMMELAEINGFSHAALHYEAKLCIRGCYDD